MKLSSKRRNLLIDHLTRHLGLTGKHLSWVETFVFEQNGVAYVTLFLDERHVPNTRFFFTQCEVDEEELFGSVHTTYTYAVDDVLAFFSQRRRVEEE